MSTACLLLLLAVPAWAQQDDLRLIEVADSEFRPLHTPQEPSQPPTLPALDGARLQILELAIENLTLKLDALKREAETFVRTLQREGYELRKDNGQWVYRPVPAPEKEQPPPK